MDGGNDPPEYSDTTEASGRAHRVRGFDSIPFDLSIFFLEQQPQAKFGAQRRGCVGGSGSEGDFFQRYQRQALLTDRRSHHATPMRRTLSDPLALTPRGCGAAQPRSSNEVVKSITHGFIGCALHDGDDQHQGGTSFEPSATPMVGIYYDEMMMTAPVRRAEKHAESAGAPRGGPGAPDRFAPNHALIHGFTPAEASQSPSKAARDTSFYAYLLSAGLFDGRSLRVLVEADEITATVRRPR